MLRQQPLPLQHVLLPQSRMSNEYAYVFQVPANDVAAACVLTTTKEEHQYSAVQLRCCKTQTAGA
jgi:hypothetical protein